jgi:hypothetical protein
VTSSCISTRPGHGPASRPPPLRVYALPSHSKAGPAPDPEAIPQGVTAREHTGDRDPSRPESIHPPQRISDPDFYAGAGSPEAARMIEVKSALVTVARLSLWKVRSNRLAN